MFIHIGVQRSSDTLYLKLSLSRHNCVCTSFRTHHQNILTYPRAERRPKESAVSEAYIYLLRDRKDNKENAKRTKRIRP